MGEMEENGGKMGEMEEIAGVAHEMRVVEGCGGMSLRKMGQKREANERKMGQNSYFSEFHFPNSPAGRRSSPRSLCKHQLTALTAGKMGFSATHRHLRRRVRMLDPTSPRGPWMVRWYPQIARALSPPPPDQ